MERYRTGARTMLPHRVLVHLVAARYGQAPESVQDWPADTFSDAVALLSITGPVLGGSKR